jgi:signal transduction histidine kinase/tetratricopeptide (TPR) repeat protein
MLGVMLPFGLSAQSDNLIAKQIRNELSKAEALIQQEKYDQAENVLKKVQEASAQAMYYNGLSEADILMGDIYYKKGKEKEAYSYYWRAYGITQISKNKEPRLQAEAVIRLGDIFYEIPSYSRALSFYKIADSLLYYYRNPRTLIHFYDRISSSYFKTGQYNDALYYYKELIAQSQQHHNLEMEIKGHYGMAFCYAKKKEFETAAEHLKQLIPIYKRLGDEQTIAHIYYTIGKYLKRANKEKQANEFYNLILSNPETDDTLRVKTLLLLSRIKITESTMLISDDDVLTFLDEAEKLSDKNNFLNYKLESMHLRSLFYYLKGDKNRYEQELEQILPLLTNEKITHEEKIAVYSLAVKYFREKKDYSSLLKYQDLLSEQQYLLSLQKQEELKQQLRLEEMISQREQEIQMNIMHDQLKYADHELIKRLNEAQKSELEAERHKRRLEESERKRIELEKEQQRQEIEAEYQKAELAKNEANLVRAQNQLMRDSIRNYKTQKKLKEEQGRVEDLRRRQYYVRWIIAGISVIVIILVVFYLSVRKKNKKLAEQNRIIEEEKQHTEEALSRLKATQEKLVESERLASLGELTAGIAHEIRNPLNFVNNFSKLNLEMLDELREELAEHIKDPELLDDLMDIAEIIATNSQKITEHGERAARIIKQMLDSSRKGGAHSFEETDINLLVEDNAKLGYQGVRGQFPDFVADLQFNLDDKIGKQKVVSQDIGRVIINLVTNACHATQDKMKEDKDFKAVLKIETHDLGERYSIVVEDNGKGMPEDVRKKIFDPFFTTKPTGVGTGLGLTMSYDIIVNVHKGSMRVESDEGKYTRFIVEIPKNIEA